MPAKRKSKPRSPDHGALAETIVAIIAENPSMSQESVATDGGLSIKLVNSYARGQGNPTYESLLSLAEGLHVRVGELMSRVDEQKDEGSRRKPA
jgi:transcriptional regulator with XRE-family HTH domain